MKILKSSTLHVILLMIPFVLAALYAHAHPPPDQPVLNDIQGHFRCWREAEAWAQFAGRWPEYTPNDADMWLQAWRARGGSCTLK